MTTVTFANEFTTFLEQFRINTFGYPRDDMLDWANECQAHAKAAGYDPIIQYYEDPFDYCNQLQLFTERLTGDSLLGNCKTALQFVTETLINIHRDFIGDELINTFYTHLCKTSSNRDEIVEYLINTYTTIDPRLTCVEDHFSETLSIPFILGMIKKSYDHELNESHPLISRFTEVECIDKKKRDYINYYMPVSELNKSLVMSVLQFDLARTPTEYLEYEEDD